MIDISDTCKEQALLHATVWERVFYVCQENAGRRQDIDRGLLRTLATFALVVGGEYRRVVNTGQVDE